MTNVSDTFVFYFIVDFSTAVPAQVKTLKNLARFEERLKQGKNDTDEGKGKMWNRLLSSFGNSQAHMNRPALGTLDRILVKVEIDRTQKDQVIKWVKTEHKRRGLSNRSNPIVQFYELAAEEILDSVQSFNASYRTKSKVWIVNGYRERGDTLIDDPTQIRARHLWKYSAIADAKAAVWGDLAIWEAA